nr:hypothetical protein [Tanacetum cinerariifolium]
MGSEAKTTSDHSPSPTVTELISELKTCFSSIDFQNVAKILMNREQDLLNKTQFLENEKDEILKGNKKLNALLKKKDVKIENLEKENDGLKNEVKNKQSEIGDFEKDEILMENKKLNTLLKKKDEKIENLERENDGLKNEVKKKQSEIGVVFRRLKRQKKVVAESSRPPPPPPPRFEEILDPKPKKEKESKHPVIIEIDDDDDDHVDRDLMKVSSSKRRLVSDETEIDDSDDDDDGDRCISVLKRKKVSEKVKKDHKNANFNDKTPTRTQPTSHSKSPFCDSSSSDSDDEKAKISAKLDFPKERWETEGHMVIEFAKDYEVCWNAICALHKQNVLQKHSVLLRPFDASRISSLSRKKTISDLSTFDLHQCRQFAMDYSAQIFAIYKEKSDTFFPAL